MSDLPFQSSLPSWSLAQRSVGLAACTAAMLAMSAPLFWSLAGRSFHVLLANYNEGWNALYIDRVISGEALYPGPDELLLNNYPPLSFLIVAGVSRLVGSSMVAGRLVSTGAFLVASSLIALIVARRSNRAAGLFAGSFFGLSFACFPGQRIGLNDPQLLAHALMLGGLAMVWLNPDRMVAVLGGAALMVLAGMTKHNLIAIPVATTAWMIWRGRRPALVWLAASSFCGVAGMAFMLEVGGAQMIGSMLAPRHVSLANGISLCRKLIALVDIPLFVSVAGLASLRARSDQSFAFLLLGAGLLEMVVFAGGDGVVANVAYDLLVAQAIAIGLAINSVRQPWLMAGLISFHFALVFPVEQFREALAGDPVRATHERQVEADIAYLAAHPGPALCFDPALCWYAGRSPEFDPFNMGQQFSLGLRSPETLMRRITERRFAVVELSGEAVIGTTTALPGRVREALLDHYRLDRSSEDRVFLLPKH